MTKKVWRNKKRWPRGDLDRAIAKYPEWEALDAVRKAFWRHKKEVEQAKQDVVGIYEGYITLSRERPPPCTAPHRHCGNTHGHRCPWIFEVPEDENRHESVRFGKHSLVDQECTCEHSVRCDRALPASDPRFMRLDVSTTPLEVIRRGWICAYCDYWLGAVLPAH